MLSYFKALYVSTVGQVTQTARHLTTGWTVWGRRGGDFSSLLRIHTGPGVHPASYKMSSRAFPGGKGDRTQDSHPVSS